MVRAVTLSVLLGLVALSGCAPRSIPVAQVKLTIGSKPEYEKFLADHRGDIVLVDFWATWCGPCVEKFPHTVELAHKYEKQGLTTLAVSLDDSEKETQVKEFLAKQGATFANLLSKDGGSSASMDAFSLDSSVPHYRLYDRAGKLVFEDASPEQLETQIKLLLQAK